MKKRNLLILSSALVLIFCIVLAVIFLPKKSPENTENHSFETVSNESDITVGDIAAVTEITDSSKGEETQKTMIDYSSMVEEYKKNHPTENKRGEKARESAKPIKEKPSTNKEKPSSGITIGGAEPEPEKYDCKTPNHNCEAPETHAFILNLEIEGCKYCDSHSCPSFYGVDEWGNAGLFPELCPKYDIKKDPVYYCQACGKKCGDGRNGTCVQYIESCNCPNCGEFVKARICHYCE